MLEDFRVITRFAVSFSDVDLLRHANNVAYLRWAEQARVDYVHEVFGEDIGGSRGLILRKTEIVYDRPLAYRERVAFGTRISRVGTKSLDFQSDTWSEDARIRCAVSTCTCVAFDYRTNTTIAIPPDWLARIRAFESALPAGV